MEGELYGEMSELFTPVKTKDLEVPDFLNCPISDELMEDPVILESGFTYERSSIEKHFQVNGAFDPLTREECNKNIIIPNKKIKHATEEFLRENPWGFEHFPGDNIQTVIM